MMGPIPMCMESTDKMVGTVRKPQKGEDKLEFYPKSRHIAVCCNGRVYAVDVFRR